MTVPTKILHSTVAGHKPASLASGQLAINEADRILYYLDPQTGGPSSLLDQVGSFSPANNLVINGAMEVDQINLGTLVAGVNGYAIDMFKVTKSGTQVLASQQVADAPPGLSSSLKATVTTANASPGATDFAYISTAVEGYRAQRLLFGSAAALNLAVGFYAKAFRAGIYGINISNGAGNRGYSTTFTIATSNVWQPFAVIIPGDITGTWPVNNTKAVVITWAMMAGSSFLMTPNSWTAGGQQGVSGQINGVQTTSDAMQITGVSVFPGYISASGTRAVGVQLPFSDMFRQCQRFYQKSYDYETALGTVTTNGEIEAGVTNFGSNQARNQAMTAQFRQPLCVAPTVQTYSPATGASGKVRDFQNSLDVNPTFDSVGQNSFTINVTQGSAASASTDFTFHWTADARL
jgi:hypothetical protein